MDENRSMSGMRPLRSRDHGWSRSRPTPGFPPRHGLERRGHCPTFHRRGQHGWGDHAMQSDAGRPALAPAIRGGLPTPRAGRRSSAWETAGDAAEGAERGPARGEPPR